MNVRLILSTVVLSAVCSDSVKTAEAIGLRAWRSADKAFEFEAEITGDHGIAVDLKLPNGGLLRIPKKMFCSEDQDFFEAMAQTAFGVDGGAKISAPAKGYAWAPHRLPSTTDERVKGYICSRAGGGSSVKLYVLPDVRKTPGERIQTIQQVVREIALLTNELGIANPELISDGYPDEDPRIDDTGVMGKLPNGAKAFILRRVIFGNQRTYYLESFSRKASTAYDLLDASLTLMEPTQ